MAVWPQAMCFSVQPALMCQLVAACCCLAVSEQNILELRGRLLIGIFRHMVAALGPLCEAKGIHHPMSFKNVLLLAHFEWWSGGNYIKSDPFCFFLL